MATVRANISGEEHDIDNRGKGIRNYEGSPTSSQNFMYIGPLTAKNGTVVFTHPPKSSCAWLATVAITLACPWHANISGSVEHLTEFCLLQI